MQIHASIIIHGLFTIIIAVLLYQISGFKSFAGLDTLLKLISESQIVQQKYETNNASSIWCRGTNNSNRFCRFENLCYMPSTKNFVFFHSIKSKYSGLPEDRFASPFLDLSSVEDHNTQYFNYVDLLLESFNNFTVEFIDKTVLVLNRFNPENLMHVIHDDLLPILVTLTEICGSSAVHNSDCSKRIVLFFSDHNPPGPFKSLYEILLPSPSLTARELDLNKLFCFKQSFVGLNKQSTWYQYGFKVPQGPIPRNPALIVHAINEFKQLIKGSLNNNQNNFEFIYGVLLERKNNRLIINEKEVSNAISSLTGFKIYTISLENYAISEIITIISNCKLLVGMHGSLLILSMFLNPSSILIELFPYAVNPEHYSPYKTLANLPGLGIIYKAWVNKIALNSIIHPEYPPELGGIKHFEVHEQENIMSAVEVPRHLCCYNPHWLFRIYQDTYVDVPSFIEILQSALNDQEHFSSSNYQESIRFNSLNLYPGEVTEKKCEPITYDGKITVNISWAPPWNLKYVSTSVVKYEILLQLSDHTHHHVQQQTFAFITKKTYYEFDNAIPNSKYHIWLRCYNKNSPGPFSTYPLICFA